MHQQFNFPLSSCITQKLTSLQFWRRALIFLTQSVHFIPLTIFQLSHGWICNIVCSFRLNTKIRQWHPTPIFLPGKSHGRRSLEGCSPWGRWGSDTTEQLHFHFSLSCIGEGNGNPLQCYCLENPREGGAWWAAFYGVAQSRTRLKWFSSSSIVLTSGKMEQNMVKLSWKIPVVSSLYLIED